MITVSYGATTYTVPAGGTVAVTVTLSGPPGREVVVPLTDTPGGGATSDDYYGVLPRVTFGATQTIWTFTVTAPTDPDGDDGETITLGFENLPPGVTVGTYPTAIITITDSDDPPRLPPVTVSYRSPTSTVPEGGTVAVTVTLSGPPGREVVVPLTDTPGNGATSDDYYGVLPRLTFDATQTTWTFTVTAPTDPGDPDGGDGETITLGLENLPPGVTVGTYPTTIITITDRDDPGDPGVIVTPTILTFPEREGDTYTVVLTSRPAGPVTVTPTVVGDDDAKVDQPTLTFTPGNWNIAQTVTVSGASDDDTTNDTATIKHSVRGANYEAVPAADVVVTVIDGDYGPREDVSTG